MLFVFLPSYHMQPLTPSQPITEDDSERLSVCLRVLSERTDLMGVVFGERSREVLASMLTLREQEQKNEKKVSFVHPCSSFRQGSNLHSVHLCGLVLEQPHMFMHLAAHE